jgi:hypothetical protein
MAQKQLATDLLLPELQRQLGSGYMVYHLQLIYLNWYLYIFFFQLIEQVFFASR